MGRSGPKGLHGPWEDAGISYQAYRWRLAHGKDPLAPKERPGRSGRYSGRAYDNPPEKLAALREKYRNGVTAEILEEWLACMT